MTTLYEEDIKRRAHEIWEREGRPEGRDTQNYFDAVGELMAEQEGGDAHARPTSGPAGHSSSLHPGGVSPAGGAPLEGALGTGGPATGGQPTGFASGKDSV